MTTSTLPDVTTRLTDARTTYQAAIAAAGRDFITVVVDALADQITVAAKSPSVSTADETINIALAYSITDRILEHVDVYEPVTRRDNPHVNQYDLVYPVLRYRVCQQLLNSRPALAS